MSPTASESCIGSEAAKSADPTSRIRETCILKLVIVQGLNLSAFCALDKYDHMQGSNLTGLKMFYFENRKVAYYNLLRYYCKYYCVSVSNRSAG